MCARAPVWVTVLVGNVGASNSFSCLLSKAPFFTQPGRKLEWNPRREGHKLPNSLVPLLVVSW